MGGVIFVDRVLMMLVGYKVVVVNDHIRVAVGTLVRVPETQSVPNLVDDVTQTGIIIAPPAMLSLIPSPSQGEFTWQLSSSYRPTVIAE